MPGVYQCKTRRLCGWRTDWTASDAVVIRSLPVVEQHKQGQTHTAGLLIDDVALVVGGGVVMVVLVVLVVLLLLLLFLVHYYFY